MTWIKVNIERELIFDDNEQFNFFKIIDGALFLLQSLYVAISKIGRNPHDLVRSRLDFFLGNVGALDADLTIYVYRKF